MPVMIGGLRAALQTPQSTVATIPTLPTGLGANLVLQLDASNAASITSSGGLVSAWTDLVTGTYQFTAAGAIRPSLVSGVYGQFSLPTIRFGGTQYLGGSGVFANLNNAGGHTIVVIAKITSGTGAWVFGNSDANTQLNGFTITTQTGPNWDYAEGDGAAAHGFQKAAVSGRLQMVLGVEDNAGSGVIPGNKKQGIYVDSATLGASGTSGYSPQSTKPLALASGNYTLGTHIFTGDICEVLGFDGPVTNAGVVNILTYSRVKWGTS